MNKIIALDIGGVCLNLRFELCREYLGGAGAEEVPTQFLTASDQYERGLISEQEWLEVFRSVTEGRFSDDELRHAWNLIIGDAIEGMPELVNEIVNAGFRAVFFSDTSELHLMHIYRNLPFVHLVSGGVFSFKTGAKKPEDKIYELFEAAYGRPYIYTDDKEENVAAGTRHGWNSHKFVSAAAFRKELSAFL